jgi:hypothetical protein
MRIYFPVKEIIEIVKCTVVVLENVIEIFQCITAVIERLIEFTEIVHQMSGAITIVFTFDCFWLFF